MCVCECVCVSVFVLVGVWKWVRGSGCVEVGVWKWVRGSGWGDVNDFRIYKRVYVRVHRYLCEVRGSVWYVIACVYD